MIAGFYGGLCFFRCFFPSFSLGHPETGIFQENFKSGIHEGFGPFSIFFILFLAGPGRSGVKIPEKQSGFSCPGQRADVPVLPVAMVRFSGSVWQKGGCTLEGRA
nr:MAG TPA: hypothetical protein [Caudoviricetes sp.]